MSYKVSVAEEDAYIRFDLFDRLTQPDIKNAMEDVLKIRRERNLNHILCDERRLEVPPNDTVGFLTAAQFATGPYMGTKLAIIRKRKVEERLFEIAAGNRGVIVEVFDEEEEAKRWLCGQ